MQVKHTHMLTCMFCFISAHIGKKFDTYIIKYFQTDSQLSKKPMTNFRKTY